MSDNFSELAEMLAIMAQEQEQSTAHNEKKMDRWWDNLPPEQKEKAFYSVVKRLNQARTEGKSYRSTLYDTFGFGANMYTTGIDAGFMEMHNSYEVEDDYRDVNRVELIDDAGRAYVNMSVSTVYTDLQDADRTLKIFVSTDEEVISDDNEDS